MKSLYRAMHQEPEISEILEEARILAANSVPLAPYWEGRTFDERLSIPLHHPYTPEQWNWIFTSFAQLLEHPDFQVRERALDRIFQALSEEKNQGVRRQDFAPVAIAERLAPFFTAIARLEIEPETAGMLEDFCDAAVRSCYDKESEEWEALRQIFLHWLNELSQTQPPDSINPDTILAAKIRFQYFGTSWAEARENLLAALDYPDLMVRACAAEQIGKFYWQYRWDEESEWYEWQINPKMPPIAEMMRFIRDKEIEKPGIAGVFWWAVTRGFMESEKIFGTAVDIDEWILDILTNSSTPEPFFKQFACHLGFYAHERFSGNAAAIRRLMDAGRYDVAIATAGEEDRKIAALEPLLMELAYCDDPWIIKSASWQLAYYYHRLHPKGAELGYVELANHLPEIDLFLIFSRSEESKENESPYAAVIYPKDPTGLLNNETAWKWIDKIFSKEFRGDRISMSPYTSNPEQTWYRKGYVKFYPSPDGGKCYNVIIGYRSDTFWNPKRFLETET